MNLVANAQRRRDAQFRGKFEGRSGQSPGSARACHVAPIAIFFFIAAHFFFYDQVESSCKLVHLATMKLSNQSEVPVYTISGSNTARPLPEWLARRRKRSLKDDPEYANRIELLQDFEFEEASQCVKVSEDGEWVMSTGMIKTMIVAIIFGTNMICTRHIQTSDSCSPIVATFPIMGTTHSSSQHEIPAPLIRLLKIPPPSRRPLS
jgi:hypothetical protein